MKVDKMQWGTVKQFARGSNHSAAFIHIDRQQTMFLEDSDSIDSSIYVEKGTCEVELGGITMIGQEGSTIYIPLEMCIFVVARFGDVDLIRVCSLLEHKGKI